MKIASSTVDIYLVAGRSLFSVDLEQHGFLCVVALHLHHDVIFAGLLFGATGPKKKKKNSLKSQIYT